MVKLTDTTCRVLFALTRAPNHGNYGLALARDAGIKSGTLYPILARLEENGLVTSQWEDIDESAEGRRRRRFYELTAPGVSAAATAAQRLVDRTPIWATPPATVTP